MEILKLTKDNFDLTVSQHSIVIIDFWAPWCAPCLAFANTFDACAKKFSDITFGKINVDEESQLANDFNIRSIPSLMVLRDQVVVFSESGAMPEKTLINLIEQAQQLDMTQIKERIKQQESGSD